MNTNHYGKCALCGKECSLSFEHIPPRMAFNWYPTKQVSGEELIKDFNRLPWDIDGLHYSNKQRGSGLFSLCNECNNNTGSWYANDYIEFVKIIDYILKTKKLDDNGQITINDIYPNRVIKQIISMFCSINKNVGDKLFNPLREFVLDKDKAGIDKTKYKLCMYLTRGSFTDISHLLF